MTLKELIKMEDNAKEVWVISPNLHYDIENKDFSELVSVNLGEKTKYKYIVPATTKINKHLKAYKKKYKLSEKEVKENFLILEQSEFTPFVMETAIYNASTKCVACAAPALEDGNDVIQFSKDTSEYLAKHFRSIWKKYKRISL